MHWRRVTHDWSLIFFTALGAYLVFVLLAYQIGPPLLNLAGAWQSRTGHMALGVAVLDLSKAPGLLLLAWLVGTALHTRPWIAAIGLVLFTYLIDIVVTAIVAQEISSLLQPLVILCRVASAALIVGSVTLVLRRRTPTAHKEGA